MVASIMKAHQSLIILSSDMNKSGLKTVLKFPVQS